MHKFEVSLSKKSIQRFSVLASVSVLAQTVSFAAAQEETADVDTLRNGSSFSEIFVTARRGSERLTDVPLVISVLDTTTLEKLNINSVSDLARLTPGLEFIGGPRPGANKISLRGLNADVGRSSVALRIDDFDVTTEAIYAPGVGYIPNQRLLDLERIEVVKGAQVALYGRSAFGGAINFVTRRPDLEEWSGSVNGQVTSEREWEVTAKVRGPIVESKLGLGLTAAYWDDNGSFRNQVSGQRVGKNEGRGMSGTLYYEPTENITNYLRVEYSQEESNMAPANFNGTNTTVTFPDDVAAVIGVPSTRTFTGLVPDTDRGNVFIPLDPFTGRDFDAVDKEDFIISNIFEADLGKVGVKSLSGYTGLSLVNFQTNVYQPQPWINPDGSVNGLGTGAVVPGFVSQVIFLDTKQDIYSQELQLFSSDEDSRFNWVVGGLYWREEIDQGQDQPTVIPLGQISTADVRNFFRQELFDSTRTFSRRTEHLSAYAWAEYDVTDQLAISVEGRYSNEDIVYRTTDTVNISLGIPIPGSSPIFNQVTVVPDPQEPGFIDDSFFTPKATITYQPNDDLTVYASAAKSVKPAGHANGSADTFSEFTRFEAEELWSYELGVKSTFADGLVSLNAAFFYQDYTNQQIMTTVFDENAEVPRGATENAGKSRIYGIDMDFTVRPTDKLTINGAYTHLNAKFIDYEFFTSAAGQAVNGPCVRFSTLGTQDGCIISYDGNTPSQAPRHEWQLFVNYTTPVTDTFQLFVEPNVRYKSKRFLTASNLAAAPEFYRVDFRAGITSENMQLTFFIENLLDGQAPTNVVEARDFQEAGFPSSALAFLPDPRTFGLFFKYSY